MFSSSKYRRCQTCRKVFHLKDEEMSWEDHRLMCGRLSSKSSAKDYPLEASKNNVKEPYIIEDAILLDGGQLSKLVSFHLDTNHICVIDDFIGKKVALAVKDEILHLYMSTGSRRKHQVSLQADGKARGSFYWLDGSERYTDHVKILQNSIDKLMTSLHVQNRPITKRSQCRVNCFPENSVGVDLHADNMNNNGCRVTCAFYCNEDYDKVQLGGVERFILSERKSVVDVEPRCNRLVVHWSDFRVVHGTRRTRKESFSLSSWYT